VPSPLAVNLTPDGSRPVLVILGAGSPVAVTVKLAERCLAALRARLTHDHRVDCGSGGNGVCSGARARDIPRPPQSRAGALLVALALRSGGHSAWQWSCIALMAMMAMSTACGLKPTR
jgi:hypothetical protein